MLQSEVVDARMPQIKHARIEDYLALLKDKGKEQYLPTPLRSGKPNRYQRSWLVKLTATLLPAEFEARQKMAFNQRRLRHEASSGQYVQTARDITRILESTRMFSVSKGRAGCMLARIGRKRAKPSGSVSSISDVKERNCAQLEEEI